MKFHIFTKRYEKMFKNKIMNLSLISVLFLHLFFPIQVIAETFLPQDPGSVYDDLTGDYGILGIASQFHVFAKEKTTINAHTEGNVATGVLSATNNFGTSISTGDLNKEINYDNPLRRSLAPQKLRLLINDRINLLWDQTM